MSKNSSLVAYVTPEDLLQSVLSDTETLRVVLQSAIAKDPENLKLIDRYTALIRASVSLIKEGRALEAAARIENLSNVELIEQLKPIFLEAGWRPPAYNKLGPAQEYWTDDTVKDAAKESEVVYIEAEENSDGE